MDVTREQALNEVLRHLSALQRERVKAVDGISGRYYATKDMDVDINNSWIFFIDRDSPLMIDGPEDYVLVHKKTGVITEITTSGGA
ncbi:MAG TPA: hypothetical protein PK983_03805 [Syntrophales bacterium]|nr:hypothetical protein [Syntrophales bacterium]